MNNRILFLTVLKAGKPQDQGTSTVSVWCGLTLSQRWHLIALSLHGGRGKGDPQTSHEGTNPCKGDPITS
jgi:hypothetical protein